jgi:putative CocE/NonD family hydrolase
MHAKSEIAVRIAFLALTVLPGAAADSGTKYEVVIERDVKIPMRDGASLLADVYHPGRNASPVEGKFPVILIRTSYNKEVRPIAFVPNQEQFVEHGYVLVIEDVRGRYKSPGHFYHGIYETNDGFDTVEWIARQPWSNGKIGMTGVSYLAAVQQATAISGAPHLASMFHIQAPMSYYQNGVRRGGAFIQMVVPIAFLFASTSREANENPILKRGLMEAALKGPDWLKRWPFGRGRTILSRVPEDERFLLDTWFHTDYDDYYKSVPLWEASRYVDKYSDVPGYYVGGWYDLYRENEFYSALAPRKKGPIKLLMGPWAHGTYGSSTLGDVDFGGEAALSAAAQMTLQLRWFDQTLKGEETGIVNEPPVRIFVMGGGDGRKSGAGKLRHGGKWRAESTWPLAGTQFTSYYLRPNNSLSPQKPTDSVSRSSYYYDPQDPTPTVGSASYYFIYPDKAPTDPQRWYVPYGPQDQRESAACLFCKTRLPLAARQDVLVFETPPLERDIEITGPLAAKLWISSSAVDTDFTARLIDVYPASEDYPEGYAMNLADGILRTHYRNGFEKPEMMKPGQVYDITIPMFATSNLFMKDHRIRLDISSSDYPAYDPNPNTGDPYMIGHHSLIANNVVYHDSERPSQIVLPIIPERR